MGRGASAVLGALSFTLSHSRSHPTTMEDAAVIKTPGAALSLVAVAFFTLLAASAACAADAADNSKVVGTWNLELEYEGEKQSIKVEIREDAGKLAGTWVGPHRTNPLEDFTWDGKTLAFVRNVNREGTPVALEHKATVDGDDMKGTITQPQGEVPFTAKRAPARH